MQLRKSVIPGLGAIFSCCFIPSLKLSCLDVVMKQIQHDGIEVSDYPLQSSSRLQIICYVKEMSFSLFFKDRLNEQKLCSSLYLNYRITVTNPIADVVMLKAKLNFPNY